MDKIYLILQFYIPNNIIRYNEIKLRLNLNIRNKYIYKIILLNERIYSNKELGIDVSQNKIEQVNIGTRLQFSDIFKYVNTH